ncbi:hypothetical protein KDN32_21105 [Nocardioides sp. J2M5]|uniref:hypothetical protein n=1 Tax=Nocardioides palaemonis TaxID=2829810 RepID=UPI001BACB78E|nr:hypothetical protein [Nocardioides palaemonis]MBS2940241.1 hypothetical protein [Nocardioides palaemonis]
MDEIVAESPTRTDPTATHLSAVVGGPVGDHAAAHPWWGPARVLLGVTGVVLAAGMVSKSACVASAWGKDQQPYAQLCWTALADRPVTSAAPPGVTQWLERLAGGVPGTGPVATVVGLALLLAPLLLLATALLVRVDPRRPWAAAGWAMAPVLAVQWLSWESLAAVGVAVLLWGWTTGRPWLAGVGAGIGAAVTLPVAVALAGVLAVGGREGRAGVRDRVDAVLAAAAAYVVVTLPGRAGLERADIGSLWLVLQQAGHTPSRTVRAVVAVLVLAVAALAVARLAVRSDGGPRTAAGAGLVLLVAGILVSGSAPPEVAVVVLPLAAVAVRRWRDLLVWQACELVSWVVTGWYVGGAIEPTVTDDVRAYWLAVLVRTAGLLWLVVAVLTEESVDDDVVDVGGGEPHPDVDLLADAGRTRP